MKINRRRIGQKIEKLAFEELKTRKFLVWKPPRVKFQSQDIFGLFDLIAVDKKELKLIQVQKGRNRPYKTNGIAKLPKPQNISFELWVYDVKTKRFRISG